MRDDFDDYFCKKLKEKSEIGSVKVAHSYSHAWSGLQFADMLAWAAFQKFERNTTTYAEMVKIPQEFYVVW